MQGMLTSYRMFFSRILSRCIKARTSLGGKIPMRANNSFGKHVLERLNEIAHSLSLLHGPGVLRRLAVGCKTTDVAHANRRGVVSLAMCAYLGNWSATLHLAIQSHHEMVANRFETLLTMPAVDVGSPKVLALGSSRTMDYY